MWWCRRIIAQASPSSSEYLSLTCRYLRKRESAAPAATGVGAPPLRIAAANFASRRKKDDEGKKEPSRDGLRVNKEIAAKFVRLVSAMQREENNNEEQDKVDDEDDGKEKETKTHEILSIDKALQKAMSAKLDLVEVNPRASPPVCRILDYGTFRFEQRKREKEQKKQSLMRGKIDAVRELRITSRIDDHDLSKKTENANKFLVDGHKVLFRINFKTNASTQDETGIAKRLTQGKEVMRRVQGWLHDFELEKEPHMVGPNHCTMLVRPAKYKKK